MRKPLKYLIVAFVLLVATISLYGIASMLPKSNALVTVLLLIIFLQITGNMGEYLDGYAIRDSRKSVSGRKKGS
jgi:hypothetical protein